MRVGQLTKTRCRMILELVIEMFSWAQISHDDTIKLFFEVDW